VHAPSQGAAALHVIPISMYVKVLAVAAAIAGVLLCWQALALLRSIPRLSAACMQHMLTSLLMLMLLMLMLLMMMLLQAAVTTGQQGRWGVAGRDTTQQRQPLILLLPRLLMRSSGVQQHKWCLHGLQQQQQQQQRHQLARAAARVQLRPRLPGQQLSMRVHEALGDQVTSYKFLRSFKGADLKESSRQGRSINLGYVSGTPA
jgi:hypothetical protein